MASGRAMTFTPIWWLPPSRQCTWVLVKQSIKSLLSSHHFVLDLFSSQHSTLRFCHVIEWSLSPPLSLSLWFFLSVSLSLSLSICLSLSLSFSFTHSLSISISPPSLIPNSRKISPSLSLSLCLCLSPSLSLWSVCHCFKHFIIIWCALPSKESRANIAFDTF